MAVTESSTSSMPLPPEPAEAIPAPSPRFARIAIGIALALFLFMAQRLFVYTPDDAYITFRYSRSLAEGYGPVFNPAAPTEDRTEGYSCPLYMLLLALLWKLPLGLDMLFRAKLVGLLCGAGTLLLLPGLARSLHMPTWAQAGLPLLMAVHTGFVLSSVNGLETMPMVFLTTLAATLFVREWQAGEEAGKRAGWTSGLVFAACALTRPEGILFGLLALGLLLWGRKGRLDTRDARWLLAFLLPVALHLLWRKWFYNDWLPGTFYAKQHPDRLDAVMKGAKYLLWTFFNGPAAKTLWPISVCWWALVLAGGCSNRFLRPPGLIVSLLCLGQIVFVLYSGGDGMGGWRFMVSALPLLMLLALAGVHEIGEAAARLAKGKGARAAHAIGGAFCLAMLACGLLGLPTYTRSPEWGYYSWASKGFTLDERRLLQGWVMGMTLPIADWLNRNVPPRSVVAYTEMGATPYFSPNVWFLDAHGLTDKRVAKLPGAGHGGNGVVDDYTTTRRDRVGSYLRDERKPDYILRGGSALPGQVAPELSILDDAYRLDATIPLPERKPGYESYMAVWKRVGPGA